VPKGRLVPVEVGLDHHQRQHAHRLRGSATLGRRGFAGSLTGHRTRMWKIKGSWINDGNNQM
jgi:hypothetical protein